MKVATKLHPTSVRLSDQSLRQLAMLQRKYGESRTMTIARIIGETFINEMQKVRFKENERKKERSESSPE